MEQQEHHRHTDSLRREAVAVAVVEALHESVGFHLAQVVAQLTQGVGFGREVEGAQHRLVHLAAAPAGDLCAGVQQHFHQPHQAAVVDLDAGNPAAATDDG